MAGRRPQRIAPISHLAVDAVADSATQRAFDATTSAVVDLQTKMRQRQSEAAALASTVDQSTWVSALSFGVTGNGFTDDTGRLQEAIDETQGRTLYMPRGEYKVTSTLFIRDKSHCIVGDFGNRAIDGGTQLTYYGTGPCIQIGTDSGNAWDANEYDGQQDQTFEDIWIAHGAPDTNLVSTGTAGSHYKAGAYGIWDWRGGGLVMRRVGVEKCEANFVGVQSDISTFDVITSLYSKYGIYIGPRSDQVTIRSLLSFFCDRCLTVDGSREVRLVDAQIVGCGTSTCGAVEVRRGSGGVWIDRAWFEHLQGYAGTDQLSYVSAGEVDGYGAGGAIVSPGGAPNTLPVEGVAINYAFSFTTATGVANHTKYIASVGTCRRLEVNSPTVPPGASLLNHDALVGVQAAQAPSITDTQVRITGVSSGFTLAQCFANLGAGSPAVAVWASGSDGTIFNDRVSLAKDIRLTNEIAATITGNTNDFNLNGFATAYAVILTATAPFNVTGFAVGFAPAFAGRWVWIYNNGANAITLTHQDAASAAGNRIVGRGGANTVLAANLGVWLYYATSQSRWLVMQ